MNPGHSDRLLHNQRNLTENVKFHTKKEGKPPSFRPFVHKLPICYKLRFFINMTYLMNRICITRNISAVCSKYKVSDILRVL